MKNDFRAKLFHYCSIFLRWWLLQNFSIDILINFLSNSKNGFSWVWILKYHEIINEELMFPLNDSVSWSLIRYHWIWFNTIWSIYSISILRLEKDEGIPCGLPQWNWKNRMKNLWKFYKHNVNKIFINFSFSFGGEWRLMWLNDSITSISTPLQTNAPSENNM